jgi:hypothetical protein
MTDHRHDQEGHASAGSGSAPKGRLSRRQVMTASAVAAGVGLASIPAQADAAAGGQAVSLGVSGTTTVEFRGRVTQSGDTGQSFTSYGYLIRASNAADSGLFAGAPRSETTALLTAYATGDLQARVTDVSVSSSVHSLDIVGTMTIYQRSQPGASFDDPSSFQVGTPVASYDMTLQDVLTVFMPGQGLPTLTGDMLQTAAATLSGPLAGQKFGRPGARLRFFATGLGALTDAAKPNSQLEIAGNWSIE